MSLYRDTSRHFDQRLRLISQVVPLPKEVDTLRARLAAFQGVAGRPILDRLAQAAIDGTDDIDLLWAAAIAENISGPANHNDVLTGVRGRIHNRIRQAYAAQAITVYEQVVEVFNAVAGKLTACYAAVDIETDAETVLDRPDKQRKAWREAPAHAANLTRVLPSLKAAAVLAALCDDNPDNDLPLAVDGADLDPVQLWTAWTVEEREDKAERTAAANQPFTTYEPITRSRCGRWSAVLRLGAELRACPPDQFREYARPKAIATAQA